MQILDLVQIGVLYTFLSLWAIMVVMVFGYIFGMICCSCKKCGLKGVNQRRSIDRQLFRLNSIKLGVIRKSKRKNDAEYGEKTEITTL